MFGVGSLVTLYSIEGSGWKQLRGKVLEMPSLGVMLAHEGSDHISLVPYAMIARIAILPAAQAVAA